MKPRDRYGIWTQRQHETPVPDWLVALLTPIIVCLYLGVLLLVAPVGLVMRVLLHA